MLSDHASPVSENVESDQTIFKLWASHLLGRHSTRWAMPPLLFDCSYFSHRVLCYFAQLASNCDPPPYISLIAGITGVSHHGSPILRFMPCPFYPIYLFLVLKEVSRQPRLFLNLWSFCLSLKIAGITAAQQLRDSIDKWDLIKLKSFCSSKEMVSKLKRTPKSGRKYLPATHQTF
jgi:hypothetical protein